MPLIWTLAMNGALGVGAYLAARHGLRQPSGMPRWLAAAVLAWAWLSAGMELLGSAGWLARGPLLGWAAAGLLVGLACRPFGGTGARAEPSGAGPGPFGWEGVAALGLVLWALTLYVAPGLFRPVKVVSDGPIYHLYFAARWWKAGRLELIATPFGESAAPHFPAVGDLWLTWLMVGWGGDRLARVGQAPFFGLAGMACLAIARRLGAGWSASAIATGWFLSSGALLVYSAEPIVDTIFVAGYLLAAYFFLRNALGDDGPSSLALGALAAGCALGTKAPAFVFVPPLLALGLISAVARGRGLVGKAAGAAIVVVLPLSVAGFWYVRNALPTGNPLYPLHLAAFGRTWLAGWYGSGVMRHRQYYVAMDDWRAFVDLVLGVIDPRLAPLWVASLAGAWAVGATRRPRVDRWVWVAAGLAMANVAAYWVAIPYRSQQRFMFHAVGLAAVPLARTLDRARWLRLLGLGLLLVHLATPTSWPLAEGVLPWDLASYIPNEVPPAIPLPGRPAAFARYARDPSKLAPLGVTLAIGATSFLAAWAWCRASAGRRGGAVAATALLTATSLVLAYPYGSNPRQRFFPFFPDYYRGWLALDQRSGPSGSRVAYAGTNLPYYLMGVDLRNEVRYVNVDAHPGWLLRDYHLATARDGSPPETWPGARPGWDRIHPDYHAWLANLRAEGIQLLVVARANPGEGAHNVADRQGFPIERTWADAHPETFEPLYGVAERDPKFRLYLVRPADSTARP